MEEYRLILVDKSQKDQTIFTKLKIIGKKQDRNWTLYKIEVAQKNLNKTIKRLQQNLLKEFYFHLYKDNELIIVFKNKLFKVKTDSSTWNEVIKYGESLQIPKEQLDFFPCKIEDETY